MYYGPLTCRGWSTLPMHRSGLYPTYGVDDDGNPYAVARCLRCNAVIINFSGRANSWGPWVEIYVIEEQLEPGDLQDGR